MSKQWTIENDTGAELTVRAPNGFAVELDANSADPRERFAYFAIRQQARDLEKLRTDLAAAVAERDEFAKHCGAYKAEAEKWESLYDDCEDALVGEQSRDNFGHGESIADCARRVIRERDQARWTLRGIAQQLIEQIGAVGPEDAIDAARRACEVIESMTTRLAAIDAAPVVASVGHGDYLHRHTASVPVGTLLIARPEKEWIDGGMVGAMPALTELESAIEARAGNGGVG